MLAALGCALAHAQPAQPEPQVQVDGKAQAWSWQPRASKPWRICLLLPHGKDRYWWGVAWGADQQAQRLGVQLGVYQAGGYEYAETQRQQWLDCHKQGAQAFVLGAISASGLRAEIDAALKRGQPVIDLVNGVDGAVTSRSLVSFADMARAAAEDALRRLSGRPLRIAWFPGPRGAGWVTDGDRGLREAVQGQQVELIDGGHGATDAKTQATLVRAVLEAPGAAIDVLLGNAVAIEFAARLRTQRQGARPELVAYYATEGIVEAIRQGQVLAAPTDQPVLQARIAIDLAVRALEGQSLPKRVSPAIVVLDRQRLQGFDLQLLLPPSSQGMLQRALPPL